VFDWEVKVHRVVELGLGIGSIATLVSRISRPLALAYDLLLLRTRTVGVGASVVDARGGSGGGGVLNP
jgi:hypothetical protein